MTCAHPLKKQKGGMQCIQSSLAHDTLHTTRCRWEDVTGLAEAKQALYEAAILPLQRPGVAPSDAIIPWHSFDKGGGSPMGIILRMSSELGHEGSQTSNPLSRAISTLI